MTRRSATALLPLAFTAITLLLGGCGADPASPAAGDEPPPGRATSTEPLGPAEPIEMKVIPAGTPLDPATYAIPLLGGHGDGRAIVHVPDGYFSAGGWVIDDGHGELAPDQYGTLTFFGSVAKVDSDPCSPHGEMRPGPGVRALADALVAQQNRTTTRPAPTTLGGHDGLYVESRAARGSGDCEHDLLKARGADSPWLSDDIPGTTDRFWIVDVNGRRVVALVQTMRGSTDDPAELIGIVRSTRFDHIGRVPPFRPGP